MNEEEQNPLVEIKGLHVRRQDGSDVLRHQNCPATEEETFLGTLVPDPDFDEKYRNAVDERFKCYICGKPVDAVYRLRY